MCSTYFNLYLVSISPEKAKVFVGEMLNKKLITKQTPKEGKLLSYFLMVVNKGFLIKKFSLLPSLSRHSC
jgi:hypothetical protein